MNTSTIVRQGNQGSAKIRLRNDLIFHPRDEGTEPFFLVEDSRTNQFYRIGLAEYALARALNGQRTLEELKRQQNDDCPERPLSSEQVEATAQWLVAHGLAAAPNMLPAATTTRPRGSLLSCRVPLVHPDRWLQFLERWIGRAFSPRAVLLTTVGACVAASLVACNWRDFWKSSSGLFSAYDSFAYLVTWLVLKSAHETAHGVVCRRYGGKVSEAGLYCLMLAPIPYVDVTSSWRFRSKWQRIHVAAAGICAEMALAIVAVAIWYLSDQPELRQAAVRFVWTATVTTLLFNANPLARFDGYYVLADLLEMPNLYARGRSKLRYLCQRWFVGGPAVASPIGKTDPWWLAIYGLATAAWSLTASLSLIASSAYFWNGAGLVLSAAAVVTWWIIPLARAAAHGWQRQGRPDKRLPPTAMLKISLAACGLVAVLLWLPWPVQRTTPGVVDYEPLSVIRCESGGFVDRILVQDQQPVEAHQVLAVLRNDQLDLELAQLENQLEQVELKICSLRHQGELAASQAEVPHLEAIQKQVADKRRQIDALLVRSPRGGIVLGRQLSVFPGTYLTAGQELCAVASEDRKHVRLSIHQDDLSEWQAPATALWLTFPCSRRCTAKLAAIDPRASCSPPHPSLCATHGGPLAVHTAGASPENGEPSNETLELLEPRFMGHVELTSEDSLALRAGQRCYAVHPSIRQSIGERLWKYFMERGRGSFACSKHAPSR